MRLIDADELVKVLHESLEGDAELTKDYELLGIDDFINAQPTAYDVDKVVKELENRVLDTTDSLTGIGAKWAYKGAINIVKAGGTND